ncbi:hypothetical protein E2C01_040963 [Portunus trituberculatus]|uniref:Uncharacterized protein n=1 Tax=Portunus trituberculatus TaxID=210409 RepID=A0A5B7FL56_PORTR|nr:hypothetical protein [Portunus trituberculatus]
MPFHTGDDAHDARGAKLRGLRSPQCISNKSVHTGCKTMGQMPPLSRPPILRSRGRRFFLAIASVTHASWDSRLCAFVYLFLTALT